MIKFFRKIRQNSLMENLPAGKAGKTGKYLKYAIGEIVLVVIGILIALQINTMNEASKNKQVERDFYADILDDFKNDNKKLDEQVLFYNNRIENLGWLLQKLRDPSSTINPTEFGKRTEPLYYGNEAISYAATFDASKSSSTFTNFKNKEILKNITQYYSDFKEVYETTASTKQTIREQLEPIMATIPLNYMSSESISLVISSESDDNSEFYKFLASIEDKRNLTVDFKAFMAKPAFENYIIGDLGRAFNALATIKKRKTSITEISKEITHFLNE